MSPIVIERDGHVAIVRIDRPHKRNALDVEAFCRLADAWDELGADEAVRAIILTGTGDVAFSAGADLGSVMPLYSGGRAPVDDWDRRALADTKIFTRGVLKGVALDKPVIAAINGLAIGGGCELACACDLRVAHPGVVLQMPPVRLGLVYPTAGLRRFVALIGSSRTRELFLTGERVPADRALAWGLVDRVVPADAVRTTALELARSIACGAPSAIAGTRRLLGALEPALPPALAEELDQIVREAFAGDEAKEARAAFRERRPPSFAPKR